MFPFKLERPLAVFDLEATGTNPRTDRIVELSVVRIYADDRREVHTLRINPGVPIPPEATQIHGITDEAVARCPTFRDLAPKILALFEGCDLGGYNCIRFDIPLLLEEFLRVGVPFPLDGRRVIDAQRIYHKREPRDLSAAVAFYCGGTHLDAHGAEADALATLRVLEGQFERYPDLPRSAAELDRYCDLRDPSWADREGRLRWLNGEITINFGKKKGDSLRETAQNDPGFLRWILKGDFPSDTKDLVQRALLEKAAAPIGRALSDQLPGLNLPPAAPKAPPKAGG